MVSVQHRSVVLAESSKRPHSLRLCRFLDVSLVNEGGSKLRERAQGALYAGTPRRIIGDDDAIFDHNNPKIKEVSTDVQQENQSLADR